VFRRVLNAFVGTPLDPVPNAAAYLADLAGFLYRFMNIITVIQFIFLDILVVCVLLVLPCLHGISYVSVGISMLHDLG
jgi:hypothetical protein